MTDFIEKGKYKVSILNLKKKKKNQTKISFVLFVIIRIRHYF